MKMQPVIPEEQEMPGQYEEQYFADAMHRMGICANQTVVGRTQRLVQARARDNQSQQRMLRSLLLPLLVCSAMVMMIAHSAWTVVQQWNTLLADNAETVAESGSPLLILTLWFLPLTMGVLVMIWFRRSRKMQ